MVVEYTKSPAFCTALVIKPRREKNDNILKKLGCIFLRLWSEHSLLHAQESAILVSF